MRSLVVARREGNGRARRATTNTAARHRRLRAADLVVAPTAAMLDALREHYGSRTETRVIPNARDATSFEPAAKQPFIFVRGTAVGRGEESRRAGCGRAARAVAGRSRGRRCASERQRARSRSIVHSLGRLTHAAACAALAAASIYALPARYEPFGLSALEAALSGCALVLGDIPSLREVWGDAAIFVDPDDHDALAARSAT